METEKASTRMKTKKTKMFFIFIFYFINNFSIQYNIIQYSTIQCFELLLTLLYIHITIVYKITLTNYKLRERYRLQIERTLLAKKKLPQF